MNIKERVRFSDEGRGLLHTIEAYYKPLRAKKTELPWEGIVFRCGTLVRLDCTEQHHRSLESFTEDLEADEFLRQDFPGHRMPSQTYEQVRDDNQIDLTWALQRRPEWATQIKKAYGCLMFSGYPLPGGIGGDRTVFPWNANRETRTVDYITVFQHLGACCCTLFHLTRIPDEIEKTWPKADPAEEDGPFNRLCAMQHDPLLMRSVDYETAEMRRLDYMFPKPFAYIDKKMNVFTF